MIIILISLVAALFTIGALLLYSDALPMQKTLVSVILIGVIYFIYSVSTRTVYQIDDEALSIRSGPIRIHIPFSTIARIHSTNNLFPGIGISMALSTRKVIIDRVDPYWTVFISPEDRDRFLEDLSTRMAQVRK